MYMPAESVLMFSAKLAMTDSYANNQNPAVVDAPQVAANFPDVEGIDLSSPTFINPGGIPVNFAKGTSGPTPQYTLGERRPPVRVNFTDQTRQHHHRPIELHGDGLPTTKSSNPGRPAAFRTSRCQTVNTTTGSCASASRGGQHGNEPAGNEGVLASLGRLVADSKWTSKVLEKLNLLILLRCNVHGVKYLQSQLASNYDPNRDHAILVREQTRKIRQLQSDFDPHIFVDDYQYAGDLLVSANKGLNVNVNANIRGLDEASSAYYNHLPLEVGDEYPIFRVL
ncbi:hypothetical protein BU25DRAFT_479674 [Macroventuria anomochaeta]|uniref:Uncharacterized protein n=1 Tax=Macroventuria anomochaeta TaxID=301207 RepID=A0ACB6RNU1_9PLEO|nr:uncharacterized protein BU25DRAFT_479674 [Macroventuria anomochaeta]KAF2622814.1 hypothetical protein BU25DRAFT_479674 [Macroventuria anomochaeta]